MSKDVCRASSDVVQNVGTDVVATARDSKMVSLLTLCSSRGRQFSTLGSNLCFSFCLFSFDPRSFYLPVSLQSVSLCF